MNKFNFRAVIAMICGTIATLDVLALSDKMPGAVICLLLTFIVFLLFLLAVFGMMTRKV